MVAASIATPAPLPGPKKKQAEALAQNIKWMVDTFGARVGFLTLTCGNKIGGRFVKVTDRREASRRFNSLLTGLVRARYRCGVIVSERHRDGGVHFHLVAVAPGSLALNWEAFDRCQSEVRERKRKGWTAQDVAASPALRDEWQFWRDHAEDYGFGRCEMLPIRKNGEAVGRYVGKYISKAWENRRPEDKGARLVRYFGKWATPAVEAKTTDKSRGAFVPPHSARFGRFTPAARMWRECCRQVALRVAFDGISLTYESAKAFAGRRWAWNFTKKFNATDWILPPRFADIEKDFAEWQSTVAQEWADQRHREIFGPSRGAGFWKFDPESMMELIEARRANARIIAPGDCEIWW
jgi:hypothetical protein